jgi:hypothetical protein
VWHQLWASCPVQVTCWHAGQYYPTKACAPSSDLSICSQNWGQWKTQEQCCAVGKAFAEGCDKPVSGQPLPGACSIRACFELCSHSTFLWLLSRALLPHHPSLEQEPCWVANAWYPSRTCGLTEDQSVCQRGWGAFASEEACCIEGAAFSDGCGVVQAVPAA